MTDPSATARVEALGRTVPPARPTGIGRLSLIACAGGFLSAGMRAAFSVEYPAIATDLGWTAAEVTTAFSIAMFVYAVGGIGTGFLIDRFGVRPLMTAGVALLALASAGASRVDSLPMLYLTWGLVMGLGMSAVGFVAVLKALSATPHRMGAGFGMFAIGQGVGAIIVSPGIQALIDTVGWRASHQVLAAVCAALVLGVAIAAPSARASRPADASTRARPDLRFGPFWLIMVGTLCLGFWNLVPTHQVAHLMLVGFSGQVAAGLAGLLGGMTLVAGLFVGRLADRAPSALMVAGSGLLVLGTIALAVTEPSRPWLLGLYVLASGLGRGIIVLAFAVIEGRVLPRASLAFMGSLLEVGIGLGLVTGPWVGAQWRDVSGSYVPGLMVGAAAMVVSCAATCAAFALHRRHALGEPGEHAVAAA